jgi:iron complex outermembrane receptor protein
MAPKKRKSSRGFHLRGCRSYLVGGGAAALQALVLTPLAQAQQSGDNRQLEEIIVTTQIRENVESTMPISIEVLTPDDLARNDIKDIIDLQNAVPGLQFFQNGSYVQANVRGVGNPSTGGPSEQVGVPIFFDGATQGEEMGIAAGFFDLGDIQVLRGPQATFVSQAAAGGAILINSARPNFDGLNGFVEATVGDYGRRKMMGAVNLQMTDKFAARVAYMGEDRDSFYENVLGQATTGGSQYQPGSQEENNYRVGLLWEPTEKFSLYTKLEQSELHQHGVPDQPNDSPLIGFWNDDGDPLTPPRQVTTYDRYFQGPAPGTGYMADHDNNPNTPDRLMEGVPGPGGALYDPLDPWQIASPNDESRITEVTRVSLEANYTFDSGITFRTLLSSIEMDRLQVEGGYSAAWSGLTGFHLGPGMLTFVQEYNIISPEGQKLEWLVGLSRNDRHTELSLNIPNGNNCGWNYDSSWTPCSETGTRTSSFLWTSTDDVIHTGLYGQLNYHITDTIELQIEARQNDDDNTQARFNYFATATAPSTATPIQCPGRVDEVIFYCPDPTPNYGNPQTFVWQGDIPTYKVGVNWEPADGHFIYAFVARGYKSGQSVPSATAQIVEEVVDDIEIGWKGTIRQGLYAEFGIFSMDYTDMQMSVFRRDPVLSQNGATNIGDSTIDGFEGSLRAVLGGFGLNASFTYTDSKLGEITTIEAASLPISPVGGFYPGDTNLGCVGVVPTQCFDYAPYVITLSGSENLFSPKLTYTLSLDYGFQMSNGGSLTPRLSLNHADSAYESVFQRPGNHFYKTDARDVLNFSLNYQKDQWDAQLFVNNLTDELYKEGAGFAVLYGDPRTIGFRVKMDF